MLSALRQRLHNDEDGFTLIELMVVVLIIAILIAIAIPTFLGVQDKAKDASAKSDLRNGITNAKAIAADAAGVTTTVDAAALNAAEPAITFVATTAAASKTQVGVAATATEVLLVTQSDSGKYFGMELAATGKVTSCSTKTTLSKITAGACSGTDFADIP